MNGQRETPEGSIAGRVLDAAGAPIAGAKVALTESPGPHRDIAAVTAADGRFRFGRLAPGRYRVAAMEPTGVLTSAEVVVDPGEESRIQISTGRVV